MPSEQMEWCNMSLDWVTQYNNILPKSVLSLMQFQLETQQGFSFVFCFGELIK